MSTIRMAIIGCGRHEKSEGSTGAAQGHKAMLGYHWLEDIEVVAAADIREDNLELFCDEHGIQHRFTDYRQMLKEMDLDAVTITTWPGLHAQMVIDAANAGVKWVHCEKPMATTFGDAKAMVRVCAEKGVMLTINHEYRYMPQFAPVKRLLDAGRVGDLVRIESYTSNLFDMGTHMFDLMNWYNNQQPVKWVMGQIDATGGRRVFGVPVEGQGFSYFMWENGVRGMLYTGREREEACNFRIIGTTGLIEIGSARSGAPIRYRNEETGMRWIEEPVDARLPIPDDFWFNPSVYRPQALDMAKLAQDCVDALKTGREPQCSGRIGLMGDELIFATYESSRRRARVDLPLDVEDNPYVTMLESGMLPSREAR